MTPRRAAKVDALQPEIVEALRAAGATVTLLHAVGDGCPDIMAGIARYHDEHGNVMSDEDEYIHPMYHNYLMEVKSSTGKLTPDQVEWHATWRGQAAIVRSVEEALKLIGR